MTTAKSSSADPGSTRGRGLDALFEGTVSPTAANHSVDADLAALLDNEVMAAETGASPARLPVDRAAVPDDVAPSARGDEPLEGVDLPPVAAEAQPVRTVEPEDRFRPHTGGAHIGDADRRLPNPNRASSAHHPALWSDHHGHIDRTHACRAGSDFRSVGAASGGNQVHLAAGIGSGTGAARAAVRRWNAPRTRRRSSSNAWMRCSTRAGRRRSISRSTISTSRLRRSSAARRKRRSGRSPCYARRGKFLLETPEEYVAAEYRTMQVRAMLDPCARAASSRVLRTAHPGLRDWVAGGLARRPDPRRAARPLAHADRSDRRRE